MTYTTPDWTDPATWGIVIGLLVLFAVQGWFTVRNQTLSPGRKMVRAGLNGLMWLVLPGYFLQVGWSVDRPVTHALLVGEDVPATYARSVQDSLHIRDRFTARTLKAAYDSVTLVGQDFPTEMLTHLSQSTIRWIPYDQPDRIQELRWKGIVRLGEMQYVTGRIQSTDKQLLRIRYGNQTLDSLLLAPGSNPFRLQFPVFSRGRTQAELVLGQQTLDTVRFYSRPARPLRIQFVLDNPDFESKTLADWLGKQAHSVQLSTTLAKNVSSRTAINSSLKENGQKPDVVITDPANAANAIVRRAISDGRAVLFINLSNPAGDVTLINRALRTRWQVRKFSNQETVPAGNNLTAHPYRFLNASNQFTIPGYPVAMQQTAGKVSVSLLNETFPLALSGDSLTYSRIWYGVMAQLQPSEKNNVSIEEPVLRRLPGEILVNNPTAVNSTLRIGKDTVQLTNSPLNRQSAFGTIRTEDIGWQPVQDSLAFYVSPMTTGNPVAARQMVSRFVLAHSNYEVSKIRTSHQANETVPGWAWLTFFLLCLTALWVEPKLA